MSGGRQSYPAVEFLITKTNLIENLKKEDEEGKFYLFQLDMMLW